MRGRLFAPVDKPDYRRYFESQSYIFFIETARLWPSSQRPRPKLDLAPTSVSLPFDFAVMLAALVLLGLLVFVIVCRKCGKSPYVLIRFNIDGRERTEYAVPWTEAVCSRSGHDFRARPIS
ncbi:hypothetical protein [Brevundimonas nasdae]|uniref:Uncharacterized protein n=1 Tax=Brevundimonas nasdae TaxID=172043 RepID=A0ACD4VQR4_9CAUL|nr:hypothetical protein [Brevundimonas nasdae]WOB79456.1 hypothetical protein PZA08_04620 [Brevundimonas nasdae]